MDDHGIEASALDGESFTGPPLEGERDVRGVIAVVGSQGQVRRHAGRVRHAQAVLDRLQLPRQRLRRRFRGSNGSDRLGVRSCSSSFSTVARHPRPTAFIIRGSHVAPSLGVAWLGARPCNSTGGRRLIVCETYSWLITVRVTLESGKTKGSKVARNRPTFTSPLYLKE